MPRKRRWLAVAALTIAIPAIGAFLYAEVVTRRVIQSGAKGVLGVDVAVGFVRLGLLGGGVELFDISIRNPSGFEEENLLYVDEIRLDVWLPGLLGEHVDVPSLDLQGLQVDLERRGESTNYGRVLRSLHRNDGSVQDPEPHTNSTFVIRKIRVRDIRADVRMLPELGAIPGAQAVTGLENIKVRIPEIVLRDVTSHGDLTELVGHLTNLVAAAVLESIARHATDLPGTMAHEFASVSGSLGSTSLEVIGKVTQVGGRAVGETIGAALGAEAQQVTQAAANGANDAISGLANFAENETRGH